ncbi:hypothetical protein [Hymenobacter defluvii]|uniref:Uncharacterized protein n=1 Tax=Hymenobacter defluvii TaxID=2054411 RepID=A0ABS3TEV9_9BACT|nr:hypothetical protein [Hymenobacter defluvii]MBO3272200.1 hypothetical protein [Hymenobacter defluvii]
MPEFLSTSAAGQPLSATHQRVLSSLVALLEDRLMALQALLGPHPAGIAQHWATDLSEAERTDLAATAKAFRAELAALHAAYHLDVQPRSPRREVAYRAAQLWEILGDAPAAKFSGYGELPPTMVPDWDARIARLTALANQLLARAEPPAA